MPKRPPSTNGHAAAALPPEPEPLKGPTIDFTARVMHVPYQHQLMIKQIVIPLAFATIKKWAALILDAEANSEAAAIAQAAQAAAPKIITQ